MTRCTWEHCNFYAHNEQINERGEVWANLCDKHAELFDPEAVLLQSTETLMKNWVKAQGGKLQAAERMKRVTVADALAELRKHAEF